MPASLTIDSDVQQTFAQLALCLAKAFIAGSEKFKGDKRWEVKGIDSKVWEISHPELPTVKGKGGDDVEPLLQFHIRPPKKSGEPWLFIGQNRVVGPDEHGSPKANILSTEEELPKADDLSTLNGIAYKAAVFFNKQKEDLVKKAQASAPPTSPAEGVAPPQGGGEAPPGMPAASRRKARLATRI